MNDLCNGKYMLIAINLITSYSWKVCVFKKKCMVGLDHGLSICFLWHTASCYHSQMESRVLNDWHLYIENCDTSGYSAYLAEVPIPCGATCMLNDELSSVSSANHHHEVADI